MSLLQRDGHNAYDNVAGQRFQPEGFQAFLRVKVHAEYLGRPRGDCVLLCRAQLSGYYAQPLQLGVQVAAYGAAAEVYTVGAGRDCREGEAVNVVVLFYRTPVVGIAQP